MHDDDDGPHNQLLDIDMPRIYQTAEEMLTCLIETKKSQSMNQQTIEYANEEDDENYYNSMHETNK